ncbi:MAG: hypothetical protein BMS9Abin04_041 [Planctomycetia bacterium]|nr:MAG: hypothetical protein BMS9Abin04_041 [Planctomycetia bacterium]
MYVDHWQLSGKPFEPCADEEFYYPGQSHQGTLLKLRYALESHRHAALLAGPSGTGKTLLVRHLSAQLPAACRPIVHLVFPLLSQRELLAHLAHEFCGPGQSGDAASTDTSLRRIHAALAANARKGQQAVLFVDEAHSISDHAAMETLRLLINLQQDDRPLLSLVLVGQPPLLSTLAAMPAFDERFSVKALLVPLDEEGAIRYIRHRLAAAGARRAIFSDAALETIARLTQGIPRQINRLGDLALLVGYAEGLDQIEREHVEPVFDELIALPSFGPAKTARTPGEQAA